MIREMQRLLIKFSRGEEVKYITHLDLMRCWGRVLHRAGVPIAYSEGFNPHPRLSLAAPLPIGVTSSAELMDLFLRRWLSPDFFVTAVSQQLPTGIGMLEVQVIALGLPSLQSQIRYSEYRVEIETERGQEEIESSLRSLLLAKQLPWQHMRDTGVRHYDLRALIDDLWLIELGDSRCSLGMRLRTDSTGSGRPEQVTAALDFPHHPQSIHRTRLILEPKSKIPRAQT